MPTRCIRSLALFCAGTNMSDSFEERGELSPESLNPETPDTPEVPETPAEPNGFQKLGLAPELVQAVADMGFVQPTAVQNNVVPKALLAEGEARYADLMVSSQTGSGKTAAFLLPVLHTLLQQRADARRVVLPKGMPMFDNKNIATLNYFRHTRKNPCFLVHRYSIRSRLLFISSPGKPMQRSYLYHP